GSGDAEPGGRRPRRHVLLVAHRRRAAGRLRSRDRRPPGPPPGTTRPAQRTEILDAPGCPGMSSSDVRDVIEETLKEHGLEYSHHDGAAGGLSGLVVALPGERRLKTNTILFIGEHS